jgi:putative FmdB family regulatory protein
VPTYQYACTECGDQLEAVQSFSDAALTECPSCHGKLRKVFNSVGIVFKGSGFYRNDSRPAEASTEKEKAAANGSDTSSAPTADKKDKKNESSSAPAAASSSSSTTSSSSSSSSSSPSPSTSTAA